MGSYRFAVSRMIPEMTQVALRTHKKDLMRETSDFSKKSFSIVFRAPITRKSGERITRNPGFAFGCYRGCCGTCRRSAH